MWCRQEITYSLEPFPTQPLFLTCILSDTTCYFSLLYTLHSSTLTHALHRQPTPSSPQFPISSPQTGTWILGSRSFLCWWSGRWLSDDVIHIKIALRKDLKLPTLPIIQHFINSNHLNAKIKTTWKYFSVYYSPMYENLFHCFYIPKTPAFLSDKECY
jgi:hypothetical protein